MVVVTYVQEISHLKNHVMSCCYCNKGRHLLVGTADGDVFLYRSKRLVDYAVYLDGEIQISRPSVTKLSATDNNTFFCSYSNGIVKHWDIETQQCLYTLRGPSRVINTVRVFANSSFILTGGDDSNIRLYEARTAALLMIFRDSVLSEMSQGHSSSIYSITPNPKKKAEFVSTGYDRSVYFWDIRKINAIGYFIGPNICSNEGLDINKDGTLILTGSFQKCNSAQLRKYSDPLSRDDIVTLLTPDKSQQLYCCKFISKNFLVLGGCSPSRIFVMNYVTHESVLDLTLPGDCINSIDSHLLHKHVDENFLPIKLAVGFDKEVTQIQFYHKPVDQLFV